MSIKDKVVTSYTTARELIKREQPRAARAYVLELLNLGLAEYHRASTILAQAKMAVFLEEWIAVSRDLYDKGITPRVLRSFGLAPSAKKSAPAPSAVTPLPPPEYIAPREESGDPSPDRGIDMAGLIDEANQTQGWCASLFEASKSAVVRISSYNATGTGFIISDKGYLLTNDHVVFDESTSRYHTKLTMSPEGSKYCYDLQVICSDKKADVALCRFDPVVIEEEITVLRRIRQYSDVMQGADCLVIGNAFGMGLAPFTGIVRYTNYGGDLVYTAPTNPGDSGGPVISRTGECIGITKSRTESIDSTMAAGFSNATPMDRIDALLEKWTRANDITL